MAILLPILTIHRKVDCYPEKHIHGIGDEWLTFIPIGVSPLLIGKDEAYRFQIKSKTTWKYPGCSTSMLVEHALTLEEKQDNCGIIYLKARDIIGIKQKGYEYYEAMILNDSNWTGHVERVEDIL